MAIIINGYYYPFKTNSKKVFQFSIYFKNRTHFLTEKYNLRSYSFQVHKNILEKYFPTKNVKLSDKNYTVTGLQNVNIAINI